MHGVTLVFDLDGTLVDTAPDLIGALNATLALEGLPPLHPAELNRMVGAGVRALVTRGLQEYGREAPPERFAELMAAFLDHYIANITRESRPYPGMEDALTSFARQGALLAVCTNKMEKLARLLLDGLDLTRHFAAVGGGDTFGVSKPDPAHLLGTIARAGGRPERAVMIGDSQTDLSAGRNAGVPVVLVDFGYTDIPARELGADAVTGGFSELGDVIKRILSL